MTRQNWPPSVESCRARGQSPERAKEFLDVWGLYASNIVAHEAIECGHYIQEEVPDKVIQHFISFFKV